MHYGADLAAVHHEGFGAFARSAAPVVVRALRRAGHREGLVVDLGCGSGILAAALVGAGYAVHGVDVSPDMVALARAEAPGASFEVGSVAGARLPRCAGVTAVGEVVSYAGVPLERLFRRVHRALVPGGVFVFDLVTPGRAGRSGSTRLFHDTPGWSVLLEAVEDPEAGELRRSITVFRRHGRTWRRSDEEHVLSVHDPGHVEALLSDSGFSVRRLRGYGQVRFGRGHVGYAASKTG